MSSDDIPHDLDTFLPDIPKDADLEDQIAAVGMIGTLLRRFPIEFLGRYEIQSPSRKVTLPAAAEGFNPAERVFHFEADHDRSVMVTASTDDSRYTDVLTDGGVDPINLYKVDTNDDHSMFTIPTTMSAFDDAEQVYMFQTTADYESLLVVQGK